MLWNVLRKMDMIRILRFCLGFAFALQALMGRDWIAGGMAALLLFQAIMNTGCAKSCHVSSADKNQYE